MAIRNSIKRAGIQMKDPPRAGAKKKLPHKETAFLWYDGHAVSLW